MIKLGDYYVARDRIAAMREDYDGSGRLNGVLIWIDGKLEPITVPSTLETVRALVEWD